MRGENDRSQTMFLSDIRKLKAERCGVLHQCLSIGACFNLASCHEFEACMTHAIESDPSVSSKTHQRQCLLVKV